MNKADLFNEIIKHSKGGVQTLSSSYLGTWLRCPCGADLPLGEDSFANHLASEIQSAMFSKEALPQNPPSGNGEVVLDVATADAYRLLENGPRAALFMCDRAKYGASKYGTVLRTNNGRDALLDAAQEANDLVMYLCQLSIERPQSGQAKALYFAALGVFSAVLKELGQQQEGATRSDESGT